jgi:bacterioferritin (cytochrome b1)
MDELARTNRDKVIDLLTERLTFERAGVKLYDAVIRRVEQAGDPQVGRLLDQLRAHREDEKEHEEWLEEQVRALGGDAHAKTELALLVEIESSGIERVILDGDPNVTHLLHALYVAEMADNAGWDLLVELADEAGDRDAKKAFKKRLHEEEEHLVFMRRAVERLTRRNVLGEDIQLPSGP